ncbi:MAG: RNA 2',3'-cyclic phosphodiesterase [Pseudomonadota bacterium]
MPRVFVGLELPASIKAQIALAQGGVSNARWQRPDQLHLTLRFIGEVEDRMLFDIRSALAQLRFHPVFIALSGLGSFHKGGRPKALWAGITPEDQLKALHNKIDYAITACGLPEEGRRFKPHVAIARFPSRGRIDTLEHVIVSQGGLTSPTFEIGHITLFRSVRTPNGSDYSVIDRFHGSGGFVDSPSNAYDEGPLWNEYQTADHWVDEEMTGAGDPWFDVASLPRYA